MNVVRFPGIGLEFEFSKVAFSIFGVSIYKYAMCIVLGIVVALILARLSKNKYDIDYSFVLENAIIGIIVGTLGARLYYVLFNLDYYLNNLGEIFDFRSGGLAIYGGLILGALAIFVNCKIRKKDVLDLFDYLAPFVALAQSIGRFGNFFNVEAYGYETTTFLRMGKSTMTGYMEVHPTFLYEALATFLIFIILLVIQRKRDFKGQIFFGYCALYAFSRAIIEGLRADSLMFFGLRISQVLSVILLIASVAILVYKKRKEGKIR